MRVAIVTPRYGPEIGGGAETLSRLYAHRLAPHADVTVLTTCALEYQTWADHFPAGQYTDGPVRVFRFSVPLPRIGSEFDAISERLFGGRISGPEAEREWMTAQGPNSPDLLAHLRAHGRDYDAVLFVPYLYATTVDGLPLVADRALLVPAFHDEPPLHLGIFDSVVSAARRLVFSTPEEAALAARRFGVPEDRTGIVGAGIDPPPTGDPERARDSLGRGLQPYALYLGRIDSSKGCDMLIRAHENYRRHRPDGLDLVMLGRPAMEVPEHPWLQSPGFVDEQTKHDAIAGATVLVCPSPFESLSLVLLEAWSHATPTLSSEVSPVLVGQSRRAGAGLWFADDLEYAAALDLLQGNPALAGALGHAGRRFVAGLTWPAVTDRLVTHLRAVTPTSAA